MNDPNTGQFMWGDVIQDLIRNYMMMQMMKGNKKLQPNPLSQAATVGPVTPEAMGGIQNPSPGMGAPVPGGPGQMPNLPPQLMQMLMQLLQQSQMRR